MHNTKLEHKVHKNILPKLLALHLLHWLLAFIVLLSSLQLCTSNHRLQYQDSVEANEAVGLCCSFHLLPKNKRVLEHTDIQEDLLWFRQLDQCSTGLASKQNKVLQQSPSGRCVFAQSEGNG